MHRKSLRGILMLVTPLILTTLACGLGGGDGPPSNAAVVEVTANTSLSSWMTQAVEDFNTAETETAEGKPVYVVLMLAESGKAIADFANGAAAPALWIPEEQVWTSVLADQGNSDFTADCAEIANSPLVIAMWRPAAESLGWPGLPLGWLDVGSQEITGPDPGHPYINDLSVNGGNR